MAFCLLTQFHDLLKKKWSQYEKIIHKIVIFCAKYAPIVPIVPLTQLSQLSQLSHLRHRLVVLFNPGDVRLLVLRFRIFNIRLVRHLLQRLSAPFRCYFFLNSYVSSFWGRVELLLEYHFPCFSFVKPLTLILSEIRNCQHRNLGTALSHNKVCKLARAPQEKVETS